jgi:ribosomal protein L9
MARSVTAKSIKTVQTSDPPATRGVALQREARRKEIDAKRAEEDKKAKEDKARLDKQQRLKMTVQSGLKGNVSNS